MKHYRSMKTVTKKTKSKSDGTLSEISSQPNQHQTEDPVIPAATETDHTKNSEINDLKDENKYLKLLLGVSHNVDQLLGELGRNFTLSDALSSPESFRRCLRELERSKEIELFVQTFQHILHISNNLSDHKKRLLGGENLVKTDSLQVGSGSENTEAEEDNLGLVEENISPADDSQEEGKEVTLNESKEDPSWSPPGAEGRLQELPRLHTEELSPVSRLGLQLSDLGGIPLTVMCHCKGQCLKMCACRTAGSVCSVRCGCSREKCKLRQQRQTRPALENIEEEKENVEVEPASRPERADVRKLLKCKKIVALQPTSQYREEADLEISFLDPKLKTSKDKMSEKSMDLTADISFLQSRKKDVKSVFSSPVYRRFRPNHQN